MSTESTSQLLQLATLEATIKRLAAANKAMPLYKEKLDQAEAIISTLPESSKVTTQWRRRLANWWSIYASAQFHDMQPMTKSPGRRSRAVSFSETLESDQPLASTGKRPIRPILRRPEVQDRSPRRSSTSNSSRSHDLIDTYAEEAFREATPPWQSPRSPAMFHPIFVPDYFVLPAKRVAPPNYRPPVRLSPARRVQLRDSVRRELLNDFALLSSTTTADVSPIKRLLHVVGCAHRRLRASHLTSDIQLQFELFTAAISHLPPTSQTRLRKAGDLTLSPVLRHLCTLVIKETHKKRYCPPAGFKFCAYCQTLTNHRISECDQLANSLCFVCFSFGHTAKKCLRG